MTSPSRTVSARSGSGTNDYPDSSLNIVRADAAGESMWRWELPGLVEATADRAPDGGFYIAGNVVNEYFQPTGLRIVRLSSGSASTFLRGEANGDGTIDISDGLFILSFLFLGEAAPSCPDALDADDGGEVDISDAVRIFGFLFLGDPEPPPPFGACGYDFTGDSLRCDALESCAGPPRI
jgi:hypothetical protein